MGQSIDEQAGADGHYQISTHDVRKLGEGDLVRGAAVIRSTLMALLPDRIELPLRRLDEFFQDAPSTASDSGPVEIPAEWADCRPGPIVYVKKKTSMSPSYMAAWRFRLAPRALNA